MAPEQLEGKEADGRTDIFAFGCVLYEMATGRKAFAGSSQASLISSIMKEEPAPVSAVMPTSPPALDRVIRKALSKDPEDRWQSAGDLGSELKWIAEGGSASGIAAPVLPSRRKPLAWLPWAAAVVFALRRPRRGTAPAPRSAGGRPARVRRSLAGDGSREPEHLDRALARRADARARREGNGRQSGSSGCGGWTGSGSSLWPEPRRRPVPSGPRTAGSSAFSPTGN